MKERVQGVEGLKEFDVSDEELTWSFDLNDFDFDKLRLRLRLTVEVEVEVEVMVVVVVVVS